MPFHKTGKTTTIGTLDKPIQENKSDVKQSNKEIDKNKKENIKDAKN